MSLSQLTSKRTAVGRRGRSFFSFLTREGSALLLALLLGVILWGGYKPDLSTVESAMWHVFGAAMIILVYTGLQAIAAITQPLGRETWPLVDLLVSLVPMLVVAYSMVEWLRGAMAFTSFQLMIVAMAGLATTIDIVLFTWFSLRINKLATEIVEMD